MPSLSGLSFSGDGTSAQLLAPLTVSQNLTIDDLPPLPDRGEGYWAEPWCGVFVVGILSATLISSAQGINPDALDPPKKWLAVHLMYLWAAVAVFCVLFLLFAEAGVIRRSPETCYPIPAQVAERLMSSKCTDGMDNIDGRDTHQGTYCVRCLVWRPDVGSAGWPSHHCRVCNRCVTDFDHHCGVFGRCITKSNMPCFGTLIGMAFAGLGTLMVALMCTTPQPSQDVEGPWNRRLAELFV
jgi:hypothetical protein